MKKIDAHVHFYGNHADDISFLHELDIRLLNICVTDGPRDWEEQKRKYRNLSTQYPECYSWCTTFDPPRFDGKDSEYVERVISGLASDFDSGAVACKIWKNIGMEFKKPTGEYLMVDDPLFNPIFDFIEKAGRPVLMHIGEPFACWQPLDEKSPHYGYYKENPQWHMYGKSEYPSHEELMHARDHVLESHSNIRFVGAHIGSLEYDVDQIAKRLNRYPNFAVDTSARMVDLIIQDNAKVKDFLTQYQDRVLYGSDFVNSEDQAALSAERRTQVIEDLRAAYLGEMNYLTNEGDMSYRGRAFKGLSLASEVAEKILYNNAHHWYGI